jgi:uncharacterized damage-inducible protein DinB
MTPRAEQFAAQFAATNNELFAIVVGCSEDQWQQPCVNDGRSIGVVAHHVATTYPAFKGIIERLASGEILQPRVSMETVHQSNAQHAQDYAAIGTSETLDALRTNGAALTALLQTLDDAQLDRTTTAFGNRELSTAQVVEWIVIGHGQEHLTSIRATIADADPANELTTTPR